MLADTDDTQKTTRYWGDVGLAYYGNDLTLRAVYSRSDTERANRNGAGAETFASDGSSERVSLRGEYRLLGGLALALAATTNGPRSKPASMLRPKPRSAALMRSLAG